MKAAVALWSLAIPCCFGQPTAEYLKSLISPTYLFTSSAAAAIGQWRGAPQEWGQGGEGYAKRFASSLAQHDVDATILFGASHLLREDNQYLPSDRPDFGHRLEYALASTVLARHDRPDGTSRRRPSISRIGALAGAVFLSRYWQPRSTRSMSSVGLRFGAALGSAMGFNVAHEFGPGWLPLQ